MFATEFSDAFTVVPEFLDTSYCLYQSSPNASYCSYQSSLMLLLFVSECLYCSYQSSLMPLLLIPEFSDAFTLHSRDAFNVCKFSDAFTVVPEFLDVSYCSYQSSPNASYCSYQSSLMPLLFIPEFSDAFTVCTRVPLLFVPEFSDAFTLHSRDAFNVCNRVF